MKPITENQIILVDTDDQPIGIMEKMEVHQKGLLHRAFSVFLFNDRNELLMQQRADAKYHSPGLWTNTCCSHPFPGEDTELAANRRLLEELQINAPLQKAFHFTYRAEFDNGLVEHEFDHVYVGRYNGDAEPNPDEVKALQYITIEKLKLAINDDPNRFTPWFLIAFPRLLSWIEENSF